MLESLRRHSRTRLLFAVAMLVALVTAQGMRLCLHASDVAVHEDTGSSAAGWHLEGGLMAPEAGDDESGDQHFDLGFGLLKHLSSIAAAILIAALLVLLPPRTRQSFVLAESRTPRTQDTRRRPPSRAPPR
jgi:hypothetical protein